MKIKIGFGFYHYFMSLLARIFGKRFGNQILFHGFVYDFPDKNKTKEMNKYLSNALESDTK